MTGEQDLNTCVVCQMPLNETVKLGQLIAHTPCREYVNLATREAARSVRWHMRERSTTLGDLRSMPSPCDGCQPLVDKYDTAYAALQNERDSLRAIVEAAMAAPLCCDRGEFGSRCTGCRNLHMLIEEHINAN